MAMEVAGWAGGAGEARGAEGRSLARAWRLPVMLGASIAVMGVVALFAAPLTGVVATMVLGLALGVAGTSEIIGAIRSAHQRRFWLTFLGGVLSVAAGVLVLAYPMRSLASTTLLLGSFFVVAGLFRVITSMIERYEDWGWDLGYGVLVSLLGTWVLSTWPISSLFVIGSLVGAELLVRGGSWIGAGFAIRKALRRGTLEEGAPGRSQAT